MYSRRREEGIGLRVGDAAELGTGTLAARIEAEIKPQLQVKAERRRSPVCTAARAPAAGNDAAVPVRPESLGVVSLVTPAPGLEVHFHILKKKKKKSWLV